METTDLPLKGLSIERLHVLCDVARLKSIRAAVGDDPARQSLASRQLKELGEYAGVDLTTKDGRHVALTPAGTELAAIAQTFFDGLDLFLRGHRPGRHAFNLGVGDSVFQWFVLPHMTDIQSAAPETDLIPCSFPRQEIFQRIQTHTLDAGIIRSELQLPKGLKQEILGKIAYRLFVPSAFLKNGGPKNFDTSLLKTMPFCSLVGGGRYATALDTFLTAYGNRPLLRCSSLIQVFGAIQAGRYAGILPERARDSFPKATVVAITLPGLSLFTRQIALVYRSSVADSPDAQHLFPVFRQLFYFPS